MLDHELVKSVKVFRTTAAYLNLDTKLKRYKDLCRAARYPCAVIADHEETTSLVVDLTFTRLTLHHDFLEDLQRRLPERAQIVKSEDWKKVLRVIRLSPEEAYDWGMRIMSQFEKANPVGG